jgi:hypothetical protein
MHSRAHSIGMKLLSMALVVSAWLLFQAPARADEVVLTPANSGVDIGPIDDNGIDSGGFGFTVTAALARISGPQLLLSATGSVFPDAGFLLLPLGGLSTGNLPGVTALPGFVETTKDVEAPQD